MLRAAVLRPLLRTARATRTFAAIPAEGSSVACGVLKNQKDPVIRPDGDYPEWLGSLTDTIRQTKGVAAPGCSLPLVNAIIQESGMWPRVAANR